MAENPDVPIEQCADDYVTALVVEPDRYEFQDLEASVLLEVVERTETSVTGRFEESVFEQGATELTVTLALADNGQDLLVGFDGSEPVRFLRCYP